MFCKCGRKVNDSTEIGYQFRRIDENGNIIYGICKHGHIVIYNQESEKENIQKLIHDADIQGEI